MARSDVILIHRIAKLLIYNSSFIWTITICENGQSPYSDNSPIFSKATTINQTLISLYCLAPTQLYLRDDFCKGVFHAGSTEERRFLALELDDPKLGDFFMPT